MALTDKIPGLIRDPELLTFREIDERHHRPKGTAFRAFKQRAGRWVEGREFHYLSNHEAGPWIEALRREGRIYDATVHLVLLTPAGYRQLQGDLDDGA
ncbi:MAG: hypothetical protein B7Z66_09020 [Chromatiales bacterium 21-64-14]|nr:MAG: hypothetical protein B7Z66_09020 [Chromatiales bacterium 21-64-14]HQU15253.1 hypothetical protein [Gammaproteobacteria bacterium]